VIPEVHGNARALEIILNRILPLRFSIGQEDKLVMLGDYIDGAGGSAEVIEMLMNVKREFPDDIVMIRGNHEDMLLDAINGSVQQFDLWMENRGRSTIESYMRMRKMNGSSYEIGANRLLDIILKEHIDFISDMPYKYQLEDYLFFHGSFNHNRVIADNSERNFAHDYTAGNFLKKSVANKSFSGFKDNYVFVGAHNKGNKKPYVHPNYMMLGGEAPETLTIFELNSLTACSVRKKSSRLHKYEFSVVE
jgi:serine/threonine protein phosphatase 1